jgi:glycosyltransferase involved in cell wall biosynthesis
MPYPLIDGGAIGIFNITRALAERGHQITFVTYPHDDAELTRQSVEAISRFATVNLVKNPLPARWKVLARTMFRGAYPIERRESRQMYRIIDEMLGTGQFDVVHLDHSHMAHYGRYIKRNYDTPVVLREHNYESLIYSRFAQSEPNRLKRLLAKVHGRRLKVEEDLLLKIVDAVAAITDVDAAHIRKAVPESRVKVIPAGVALDEFRPFMNSPEPDYVLFVGSMIWDPNLDAATWFIQQIFPLIQRQRPDVELHFVGGLENRLRPFVAGNTAIILHGQVPDIRDYLGRATVLVVPLRVGGGMRVKLLEFFASGKAVVSTSIGSEGNLARDGVEVLLADEPEAFAMSVVRVLSNTGLRNELGSAAHDLAVRQYSWFRIGAMFEELYRSVLRVSPTASVQQ